MKEIRIGLAGLGHRGLHWLRLMKRIPEFRVVALYDWIEPLHAAGLAETGGDAKAVRCYTDYARFLSDPDLDDLLRYLQTRRGFDPAVAQ